MSPPRKEIQEEGEISETSSNTSEDYQCESDDIEPMQQNRRTYNNPCEMMERTGISNRDACKIINVCTQDMKLNTSDNLLEPTVY